MKQHGLILMLTVSLFCCDKEYLSECEIMCTYYVSREKVLLSLYAMLILCSTKKRSLQLSGEHFALMWKVLLRVKSTNESCASIKSYRYTCAVVFSYHVLEFWFLATHFSSLNWIQKGTTIQGDMKSFY